MGQYRVLGLEKSWSGVATMAVVKWILCRKVLERERAFALVYLSITSSCKLLPRYYVLCAYRVE